jgi:hypothetical protein
MEGSRDAVSVSDMARMIHLSRTRFYQLMGTTFPLPQRDSLGRPFFDRDQQEQILAARRRNVGLDGKPILFRLPRSTPGSSRIRKQPPAQDHTEIVVAVRALGIEQANSKHIGHAIATLFPDGQLPPDRGDLIRQVFLFLNRQFSADNQQR